MDFIENLNESWELRFEEVGETETPTFILQDIDNDILYNFYPEDTKKIIDFIHYIKNFSSLKLERNMNESFNLKYYPKTFDDEDYELIFEDLDNKCELVFYPEDIQKIEKFLNRLVSFGVIKN